MLCSMSRHQQRPRLLYSSDPTGKYCLQDLLEVHMNMPVRAMRSFAQMSPADRGMQVLPGACLPARGFYRIKSVTPSQLQKASKTPSSWWSLPFRFSKAGALDKIGQQQVSDSLVKVSIEEEVISESAPVNGLQKQAAAQTSTEKLS